MNFRIRQKIRVTFVLYLKTMVSIDLKIMKAVRGYHVFKDTWNPEIGGTFQYAKRRKCAQLLCCGC